MLQPPKPPLSLPPSLPPSLTPPRYEVLEVMNYAKTDLATGIAKYNPKQHVERLLLPAHLKSFVGNFWSGHLRFFR